MPEPTPPLELDSETLRIACVVDGDLELVNDVVAAAVDVVNAVDELLAFIPDRVSPVVVQRDHLAAVQAARDALLEAAGDLIVAQPANPA